MRAGSTPPGQSVVPGRQNGSWPSTDMARKKRVSSAFRV